MKTFRLLNPSELIRITDQRWNQWVSTWMIVDPRDVGTGVAEGIYRRQLGSFTDAVLGEDLKGLVKPQGE